MRLYTSLLIAAFICLGCKGRTDINFEPVFSSDTGLPKNCRAIIAVNIKAWREKQFSADEVLTSIDRNCGANGHSWGEK